HVEDKLRQTRGDLARLREPSALSESADLRPLMRTQHQHQPTSRYKAVDGLIDQLANQVQPIPARANEGMSWIATATRQPRGIRRDVRDDQRDLSSRDQTRVQQRSSPEADIVQSGVCRVAPRSSDRQGGNIAPDHGRVRPNAGDSESDQATSCTYVDDQRATTRWNRC